MKKSIYFLILGKVVFMSPQNSIASAFCLAEADTKKEICLGIVECQGKFQTLLRDLTEPKCHKTKH